MSCSCRELPAHGVGLINGQWELPESGVGMVGHLFLSPWMIWDNSLELKVTSFGQQNGANLGQNSSVIWDCHLDPDFSALAGED